MWQWQRIIIYSHNYKSRVDIYIIHQVSELYTKYETLLISVYLIYHLPSKCFQVSPLSTRFIIFVRTLSWYDSVAIFGCTRTYLVKNKHIVEIYPHRVTARRTARINYTKQLYCLKWMISKTTRDVLVNRVHTEKIYPPFLFGAEPLKCSCQFKWCTVRIVPTVFWTAETPVNFDRAILTTACFYVDSYFARLTSQQRCSCRLYWMRLIILH